MHLEVVKDCAQLPRIRSAWEALCAEASGSVSAFASFDWYETWWRHYAGAARLNLILMWDAGKLSGIAPFMLQQVRVHGVPARALCFIGNNQSLNNDFIVLPRAREVFLREVLRHLFDQGTQWEMMVLKHLGAGSPNYRCLTALLAEKGRAWRQLPTAIDSPYLVPCGAWKDYLASRTMRTRKGLRNIENGMHRAGEVSLRNIRTEAEFLGVADQVFELARLSWSEKGGDSLASPGNEGFYRELALRAAAKGWLSLWTLSLDGRLIAVEFHLRAYGKEHALRGHYLPEYASLSPGTYLELQILKNAFEEEKPVDVYDFCGSFENYKRKWTGSSVPHFDVEVFGPSLRSRLIAMNETRLVPLLKRALPQGFWNNRLFKICGVNTRRLEIK